MLAGTRTHTTLLARLSDGEDSRAWTEFVERYGELIRGFSRRHGLQAADMDDLLQEVLLSLTKAMPGFRYDPARGKFRSYLKTVTLHAIFKRSCQNRAGVPLEEIETRTAAAVTDREVDALWEAQWRQYHLRTAMRTIDAEFNESDRAAFDSYAVQGRDAKETAAGLGLTVDHVYQAKSRITRRLCELIEQQIAEEG